MVRRLLDGGSRGNYINKVLSSDALTDYCMKQNPTTMIMADRHDLPSGPITQYNSVKIWIVGHEKQLALDTASLGYPIILEIPWYKRHDPRIDYSRNTITFDAEYCCKNCYYYSKMVPLDTKVKPETQTPEPETQTPREIEPREPEMRTPKPETQTPRKMEL